jgi:hypothetical protein
MKEKQKVDGRKTESGKLKADGIKTESGKQKAEISALLTSFSHFHFPLSAFLHLLLFINLNFDSTSFRSCQVSCA